jgi:hypothetical protein
LLINERGQNARSELNWNGVEVVGRRQSPPSIPFIEESVVTKMIVSVGDQNGEHDAPPKLMQVF